MLLQSKFYSTLLYIVFVFFLAFLFAFFISSAFIKKKKTKKQGSNQLPSVYLSAASISIVGYSVCIEDNAYFCSGGGHTLIGTNYVHVTCSVYGNNF